jgi:hypothetical protein
MEQMLIEDGAFFVSLGNREHKRMKNLDVVWINIQCDCKSDSELANPVKKRD